MVTSRRRLPERRLAETFQLRWGNQNTIFAITVGYYPPDAEGRRAPGEVFITGSKSGSDVDAATRDNAILISLALQFGVPLGTMQGAMTREPNGQASTIAGRVVDLLVEAENE